jgi:hydroxyethylthiazole kinase-like uncharacterized protein yjeF
VNKLRVATPPEMSRIDQQAILKGIPQAALMESAGKSTAFFAEKMLKPDSMVGVVCGAGNNGGDGLVAARYLANRGHKVIIFISTEIDHLSGVVKGFAQVLQEMKVPFYSPDTISDWTKILAECDLLIEALLGTGSMGEPRGIIRQAIEAINQVRVPVLAVDIPAGVNPLTGEVYQPHISATKTVTFAAYKPAHLLYPAKVCCQEVEVADIGIPQNLIIENTAMEIMTDGRARELFPPRPASAHKGTFGTVGVIAGSKNMPGAAVLTLMGALHSGCGLVRWAGPGFIAPIIASRLAEATYLPLPDEEYVTVNSLSQALKLAQEGAVLVLGPGMGLNQATGLFVKELLANCKGRMVVDADGLNHLAANPQVLHSKVVITPHIKEMARLINTDVELVKNNPFKALQSAVDQYKAVVLLKGSPTFIANPNGEIIISPAGNPILSVGGSGDVLSGIIAGLLAQGMDSFWAAALGAYWHGRTADIVAGDLSDLGVTSAELVSHLANAKKEICQKHGGHKNE